jgi:hypothetical protein
MNKREAPKRVVYFPLRIRREEAEAKNPEKSVLKKISEDARNKTQNINGDFFHR